MLYIQVRFGLWEEVQEPAKRDVRMVRGMELYVAPDKNAQALTGYRITG